jgi:transformation/transcription domain-associated protein
MTLFDPDPRATENPDLIEGICTVLAEVDTHVFQHVWRDNIDFFFECAQKKLVLLNVCQALFTREQCSPTLLAIVLGFLVQHLPKLGEEDDLSAATTIRLFKMAFGAVATHTQANEPILAHYISRLLLDCFPLAAKAPRPTNYFHLLRNLFRAIGAGGGRFEILYKEVLPLLPEMLESLNKQLLAMENPTRDIIVELCLTVPLRLTHLIPHWRYLMRPLTLALKSGPDLVAQGLRTLDLCIDNLNIEYITSTLDTVLPELVEALQRHLKPLPANHHQAHTAVRVLGKLGGRNRSLVTAEPRLKYTSHSEVATVSVSFIKGHVDKIELRPMVELSSKVLKTGSTSDKLSAFQFLDATVDVILQDVRSSFHAYIPN